VIPLKSKAHTFLLMELEKNFSIYLVEFIFLLMVYVVASSTLNFHLSYSITSSMHLPYEEAIKGFSLFLAYYLSRNAISAFEFNVLIIVVVVSLSFADEISRGYMRVLLSYPLSRKTIFCVKTFLIIIVPYLVYLTSATLLPLVYTSLSWNLFFAETIAKLSLIFLFEIFFVSSITILLALLTRSTSFTVLFSLVILFTLRYSGYIIGSEYVNYLPPFCFNILADYLIGIKFLQVNVYKVTAIYSILSAFPAILSYLYFTRRFDACRR